MGSIAEPMNLCRCLHGRGAHPALSHDGVTTHPCTLCGCVNFHLKEVQLGIKVNPVRVVNDKTGGEKDVKEFAYNLIPWDLMDDVALLYYHGAKKYAPDNWRRGFAWSLSFAAACRHLFAFWRAKLTGGDTHHEVVEGDPSTRCHHLASVIFHSFALMHFERNHPDLDDRPTQ